MADFNWHTEEDARWEDKPSDQQEFPPNTGRSWLPILLILTAVLLLSVLLFWQARSRVRVAEDARTDDIAAVSNLLVYAADRGDPSVLLNILPLENATWTNFQRAVVDHDLLLDRWPFGLQSASQEPFVKDIALSPDLQTADVILEIPYHINNKGQLQTIRLQHTHHYQFRNNWHWSEPDVAYWGGLGHEIYEKGSFTALYPARDEAIVQRLIDDLSAYSTGYFAEVCGSDSQPSCSFALDILLYFEKEPAIWLDMESRLEENGSYISRFSPSSIRSNALFFPTPSLVGLPVDEAGYQALLQGYGSHIFSAVMAKLYETECCPDDLPFPLFLETEMAQRGLGFWPPPAVNKAMAANPSPNQMPDKDIALLCATDQRGRLQLHRFDLATGTLWPELVGRNIVRIRAAPNGQGILAQEADFISDDEVLTRIIYWHNRTARILYQETLPETVYAGLNWQVHEEEQRLLIILPDLDNRVNTFIMVGLADCASGNCPKVTNELIGSPTWSPDGSQFLVKSGNILWWRQFVGDKISQEPLGLGTAPFWLDNNTFGFVRTLEDRFQEIVYAAPADEEMSVALTSERLRLLLSEGNRPDQLMIGYVGLNPVAPASDQDRWTILAFEWLPTGNLGQAFVFSYDRQANALSVLLQSEQLHSFNLSPNGRWLAASFYDTTLDAWRLTVEPTQPGDDIAILPWQAKEEDDPPSYDWTADNQSLLILHRSGAISIVVLVKGDREHALHDVDLCR
jgi:hypothetical protein